MFFRVKRLSNSYCFSLLHKFHQFWQVSQHHWVKCGPKPSRCVLQLAVYTHYSTSFLTSSLYLDANANQKHGATDFHSTSWIIWQTSAFFSLFSLIPKNHCPCLQILLHLTTEEFSTRRCRPEDCDFDPLSLEHKDFSWFLETFNVMYCRKLFYFTLKTIVLE